MKITIHPDGVWYHGSNRLFSELREGSTITQWKELAEAFSHQRIAFGTMTKDGLAIPERRRDYCIKLTNPWR